MNRYKIFTKDSYSHNAKPRLLFTSNDPEKDLAELRSKHKGVLFYSVLIESFYEKHKLPIVLGSMIVGGNLFLYFISKIGVLLK